MQKRVGILRGGTGEEYRASVRRGGEILSYLAEHLAHAYKPLDIFIDKEGVWHLGGVPIKLSDLMHRVDAVWNVAHANHSHSLDSLSIPHISPSPFFASLMRSKDLLRKHMQEIGVKLPRSLVLPLYREDFDGPREQYAVRKAKEVFEKFGAPWIVRSYAEDKNMGIHLAKTFPELARAIEDGVAHGDSIAVEEFIGGTLGTTHCVPGFRGKDVYVFPVGGGLGAFGPLEKKKLSDLSEGLYRQIGAHHYLKTDFVLDPHGKVYLLQMDATPDLKAGSHFSQACESIGARMHAVVGHMLERALNR